VKIKNSFFSHLCNNETCIRVSPSIISTGRSLSNTHTYTHTHTLHGSILYHHCHVPIYIGNAFENPIRSRWKRSRPPKCFIQLPPRPTRHRIPTRSTKNVHQSYSRLNRFISDVCGQNNRDHQYLPLSRCLPIVLSVSCIGIS